MLLSEISNLNTQLISDIERATGTTPVRSVVAYPSNLPPDDPENWLECNGQPVPINSFLYTKLHMSHTPHYQGIFLRGFGPAQGSGVLNQR